MWWQPDRLLLVCWMVHGSRPSWSSSKDARMPGFSEDIPVLSPDPMRRCWFLPPQGQRRSGFRHASHRAAGHLSRAGDLPCYELSRGLNVRGFCLTTHTVSWRISPCDFCLKLCNSWLSYSGSCKKIHLIATQVPKWWRTFHSLLQFSPPPARTDFSISSANVFSLPVASKSSPNQKCSSRDLVACPVMSEIVRSPFISAKTLILHPRNLYSMQHRLPCLAQELQLTSAEGHHWIRALPWVKACAHWLALLGHGRLTRELFEAVEISAS